MSSEFKEVMAQRSVAEILEIIIKNRDDYNREALATAEAEFKKRIFAESQELPEQGDAEACYKLGVFYHSGQGVSKDNRKAAYCYWKAAEQGYAMAQHDLGACFANGEGVPQDWVEAARWTLLAAEQGDVLAQYCLATQYDFGRGVDQNYSKAVKWYLEAAKKGHLEAQTNLAYLYAEGRGVPRDYFKAAKLYRKAAEKGHAAAQFNLGLHYVNGQGVQRDKIEAYMWFELAASQGIAEAQMGKQSLISEMNPIEVKEGQKRAREWSPGSSVDESKNDWAAFEHKKDKDNEIEYGKYKKNDFDSSRRSFLQCLIWPLSFLSFLFLIKMCKSFLNEKDEERKRKNRLPGYKEGGPAGSDLRY